MSGEGGIDLGHPPAGATDTPSPCSSAEVSQTASANQTSAGGQGPSVFRDREAPKLLLLVHGDPASSYSGEIWLRAVAQHYPPGRLVRFSTVPTGKKAGDGQWLGFPSVTRDVPHTRWPIASSLQDLRYRYGLARRIAAEVADLAEASGACAIWSVLNAIHIVDIAWELGVRRGMPILSLSWDPPESFCRARKLDPISARIALRRFAEVLRCSRGLAVTGAGMEEIYAARYGVHGVRMVQGIARELWQEGRPFELHPNEYVIAFAGWSLYAKREWNAFLRAIRLSGGSVNQTPLRIIYMGRFPRFGASSRGPVTKLGQLSLEECLRAQGEAHVAYLPYGLARSRRYATKTCFPNKLSAYVAAGLPIFFHGPADSAPAQFIKRYPVGLCCSTLDPRDIYSVLRRLLTDRDFHEEMRKARRRALEEELGLHVMHRRFEEFASLAVPCAG